MYAFMTVEVKIAWKKYTSLMWKNIVHLTWGQSDVSVENFSISCQSSWRSKGACNRRRLSALLVKSVCECTIYKYTSVCTMDCIFSWSLFWSIFVQGSCPTSASSTNPDPCKEKEHPKTLLNVLTWQYFGAIFFEANANFRRWTFGPNPPNMPPNWAI